jgi:hypothetical protein
MQAAPPLLPVLATPGAAGLVLPPPAVPPAPQPTSYFERYSNPAYDKFLGNYVLNLYNKYAVGNHQPAPLRNNFYRDSNVGTGMHVLAHISNPQADPDDPGLIVLYHHLTRRDTGFGEQA